jgi:hypothetical protein
MTQIAQWQTSVAGQTLTAQPTVTGTLSATPTPTSSLTPSVTPTGTLPTVAPTIDPRGLTALAALGTSSVLRATANASATRGAALQAANQTAIAGLLPTEAPTNPLTPDVSLLFNPPTSTKTPTPTAQLFTAQIAPAVTLIGVVIGTPTATPPPQAANPVQGGAQAAITIMPPRSSATPAAVLIQPDIAVQAINTPVAGEPVQPTPAFDRDGDLVPDALDACPDERNLTPNGCPPPNLDRDGDGTLDYADACPDQPGDITSRARDPECPDTDNDDWTDDVDECPDQPALLFGGCPAPPDRDGDGVLDSEDQCPDVRHESSSGCPDSDGDDFNDANDSCPNQAAPFSSDGCPTANDRDGDGIPNNLDRCPDSFNLTLNGCPPGVREFTPTHTPTITPASVDLTGPTPGLVFIPSPVPTTTPMPQVSSPLDGAQAVITVIAVLPSATPTGLTFSGQIAPAVTLVLAPSFTPSPPGVIGISPTPASPQGVTPTPTMTPNLVFRPPSVRAPASLVWDPLSPGPFLSARNLSFTDPNPANSGAGLVVVLTVSDGELFTFDPVAGRLAGRRLIFDSAQELANLLAGMYYQPGAGGTNPVRIVLEAFYLRGLNDRSPTVTAVISLAVPAATPPG